MKAQKDKEACLGADINMCAENVCHSFCPQEVYSLETDQLQRLPLPRLIRPACIYIYIVYT